MEAMALLFELLLRFCLGDFLGDSWKWVSGYCLGDFLGDSGKWVRWDFGSCIGGGLRFLVK